MSLQLYKIVSAMTWQVGPGCEVTDLFGGWATQAEVSDAGCLLVRPDGHVAFRSAELSPTPIDALSAAVQRIVGFK